MTQKEQVISYIREHPEKTRREIADDLHVKYAWVTDIVHKYNLEVKQAKPPELSLDVLREVAKVIDRVPQSEITKRYNVSAKQAKVRLQNLVNIERSGYCVQVTRELETVSKCLPYVKTLENNNINCTIMVGRTGKYSVWRKPNEKLREHIRFDADQFKPLPIVFNYET